MEEERWREEQRAELTRRLSDLVRIPSPPGKEEAVIQTIYSWMLGEWVGGWVSEEEREKSSKGKVRGDKARGCHA